MSKWHGGIGAKFCSRNVGRLTPCAQCADAEAAARKSSGVGKCGAQALCIGSNAKRWGRGR